MKKNYHLLCEKKHRILTATSESVFLHFRLFFQKQKLKDENIQSSKSIKPTVRLSNQLTKHSSIRSTFYYYPYGPSIDGLVIDGFAVLIFVVVYLDFEL